MEVTEDITNHIRKAFASMKSKADFLALLNYVKPLVYGKDCAPFELKQITYYANPKVNKARYYEFSIRKKDGNVRKIHAPAPGLKAIQKCLNLILQTVFEPNEAVYGFVAKRGILQNAQVHVGANYVYNIDLKDFFPSIDQARVWRTMQLPPFNLGFKRNDHKNFHWEKGKVFQDGDKKRHGNLIQILFAEQRLELNNIISALVCHEIEVERLNASNEWEKVRKNVLPQGAPTSPTITNIVCQKLDFILTGVAKAYGLKYSRYADDITFSSMHNVYNRNSQVRNKAGRTFLDELDRVIHEQNFYIKESKVRLQKKGYRQEVTGLIISEKVNVPQKYIRKLRAWLHRWEVLGFEKAEQKFLRDYLGDRGYLVKGKPGMVNVIEGKLLYLEMIRGKNDSLCIKLRMRFENLVSRPSPQEIVQDKVSDIFKVLRDKGLSAAREKFPMNIYG